MVHKILNKHKIQNRKWDILVSKIQADSTMADESDLSMPRKNRMKNRGDPGLPSDSTISQRLKVSEKNLQQAWTPNRRVSKVGFLINVSNYLKFKISGIFLRMIGWNGCVVSASNC